MQRHPSRRLWIAGNPVIGGVFISKSAHGSRGEVGAFFATKP